MQIRVEVEERVVSAAASEEARDDRRVDNRLAFGDSAQRETEAGTVRRLRQRLP